MTTPYKPKYLSWSQYDLYRRNPEQYAKQYFLGEKGVDTQYTRYGSKIAKLIEDGKVHDVLPDLTVYHICEHKLYTDIDGYPLLGYIDSYDPETNTFREYKTGKVPWNILKVYKHGQLLFYAIMLRRITGNMPTHCHLDWIDTKDDTTEITTSEVFPGFSTGGEEYVNITGRITSFKREFDERELDKMEREIMEVIEKIKQDYQKYDRERNTQNGDNGENEDKQGETPTEGSTSTSTTP